MTGDRFGEDILTNSPMCRRGDGFADKLEIQRGDIAGRAVPYGEQIELMPGVFEIFEPGAFARQAKDPTRVKICLEHGQVVGQVNTLTDARDAVTFRGRISSNPGIPEAARARALLDDELVDELSIGFQTVAGGTKIEQSDDGILYRHTRARLLEISLVPWGAYGRSATVTRARIVDRSAMALQARQATARAWVAAYREAMR